MKLFPDLETRKRFMKKGLPVVLAVAWAPILWMLLRASLAPLLMQTTGSLLLGQAVILPLTAAVLFFFLRLFRFIGEKIHA